MKQIFGYTEEDRVRFQMFHEEIKSELIISAQYKPVMKDILVVVRDQFEYVKECIESIQANTSDYRIYVWDNGSQPETAEYLIEQNKRQDFCLTRVETNEGFIKPNNRLAELGKSPYIVLLNSDTFVRPGWDKSLVAHVEAGYAQTGYLGGLLNETGEGDGSDFGSEVDYISGWCCCVSREVFAEFGLFDEVNLDFAYCEDADFSLRLKEAGRSVYALHLGLVHHYENKTITTVATEKDVRTSFKHNHEYMQKRWSKRLSERKSLSDKG